MSVEDDIVARATRFVAEYVAPRLANGERPWYDEEVAASASAHGIFGISVPKEFGGSGASFTCKTRVTEVIAGADFGLAMALVNSHNAADNLARNAHPDVARRYVGELLAGRMAGCTALTEPGAGSDFASITTHAVRDGDGWVINGQKVWTSGAHYSDFGILLTRTDPSVPKHKGLTMFYIDMKDPAVVVKPIKQINGGANFNEVYFTDLRVKDSQRLGAVGDGWKVALTTLMHERLAVGGGGGGNGPDYKELLELARATELEDGPAIRNASVREKIADTYVRNMHPYHAHPHFTPDGRKIIYTDTNAAGQVRVTMIPAG